TNVVTSSRVVLMPLRGRDRRKQSLYLIRKRGRSNRAGEYSQSASDRRLAAEGALRFNGRTHRSEKSGPGGDAARAQQRIRAIRIVESQHRGLRKRIACAEAGRMIFVALD